MASRSRSGSIGLQTFIQEAEAGLTGLTEQSSKDLVLETMRIEMDRLDRFVNTTITEADALVESGIAPDLLLEASYYPPPLARPKVRIRPNNDFYRRIASSNLLKDPQFSIDWVVPGFGYSAGLEINAWLISPYSPHVRTSFALELHVNFEQTIRAFKWLFQEWRRPLCQLLRGLPNLELWGNGITLTPPKGSHTKDPARLLEKHLNIKHDCLDDDLISLQSSFHADDTDQDVLLTLAVFLALFDAIYHLADERANPDRLLRHYEKLISQMPKVPFRKSSLFTSEDCR